MRDFLGVEIQVGDVVVYPVRRLSSMWLRKGTVREVLADRLKVAMRKTVRLPVYPVKSDGFTRDFKAKPEWREVSGKPRLVTVSRCDLTVVIRPTHGKEDEDAHAGFEAIYERPSEPAQAGTSDESGAA